MSTGRFPGWRVVTGCFIVLTTSSGLGFYGLAVYLNALSNERGWDVSSISLATTWFFFVGGVVGVWTARLIVRYDIRAVVSVGGVIGGLALAALGRVTEHWQLFVVYGVFAVGWAMAGLVPMTTVVTRWFHRRRSVALSVASTGLSAGGILITPGAKWLLDRHGLEAGTPWLGLVYVVGIVPFTLWLVRPDPAVSGWLPDGERAIVGEMAPVAAGTPYREAVASRFFVAVTIGYVLALGSQVGGIQQLVKLVEERTTADTAALATLVLAATSVVARLIGGRVVASMPMVAFTSALAAIQVVALVALGYAGSTPFIFGSIVLFGATIGNILMLQPLLIAERFGVRDYPRIYSRAQLYGLVGTAGGPLLLGWLHDAVRRLPDVVRRRRLLLARRCDRDHVGRPCSRSRRRARGGAGVNELCDRSAVELAAMIRRREVSARELLASCLARIDAANPVVNAIVTLVADRAEAWASEADARTAGGAELGPLHGLPIAHKDLALTAGIRTTMGSPILADFVPREDGLIVRRLRSAGAITIGKTNTPEFGAGSQTFNTVFGATRNPFDITRTCGGSSGGAAVALAAGMIPIADGSDMGGSLRNPASFCNVVGLRPTDGRVPTWPTMTPWSGLGTSGAMARSVDDLALQMLAIAGPDPRIPISLPDPGGIFADVSAAELRGVRVAWSPDLGLPVDPAVRDALANVPDQLAALGCDVTDRDARSPRRRTDLPSVARLAHRDHHRPAVRPVARRGQGHGALEHRAGPIAVAGRSRSRQHGPGPPASSGCGSSSSASTCSSCQRARSCRSTSSSTGHERSGVSRWPPTSTGCVRAATSR